MAYQHPLLNLYDLSDEDFAAIPICDYNAVIRHREVHKIADNQAWLYEVCRDISPSRQESTSRQKSYPRYYPIRPIARGGNGLVLHALDNWRNIELVLKIPWPFAVHDQLAREEGKVVVVSSKIETGAAGLYRVAKSLYKKLEKPKKKDRGGPLENRPKEQIKNEQERERRLKESTYYERFHRSYMFQKQMHLRGMQIDKYRKFGYVPDCYDFGFDPKCYFSMELITGVPLFSWVLEHSDEENIDLFRRIVTFVESVFHDGGIAHCDLDVDSNILMADNYPVFLDFGSAKGEHVPTITLPGTQIGKPGSANRTMMTDAVERGYPEDVFLLGRVMWSIVSRRRPALKSILCQEVDGKLVFDLDLIQSLHDENLLPKKYRNIFRKTWQQGYKDISEFRTDLETLLYVKQQQSQFSCAVPCEALRLLYDVVKVLVDKEKP